MTDKQEAKQAQAKPEPKQESAQESGPVAGGVYIVNGTKVDANGKPVKG